MLTYRNDVVNALPIEDGQREHVSVYSVDGFNVVAIDCPACEYGYTAEGRVCSECFGVGDISTTDLEEMADILSRWS